MAITPRLAAITAITAASIGLASWAAVRYLVRPAFQPPVAATPGGPGAVEGRRIKASLFYVAADGLRLVAFQREVAYADGTAEQAKRIIEALLDPAPAGLASAIPKGTALRDVYLDQRGAAYVDFSGAIRSNHPGGSLNEILTVYAIVSSIAANLPAVTSVQILIDGHEADTLAGHVDLRRPLPRAAQWTEKGPS